VESIVADMWSALLGMETVRIDDEFFALGGTSLVAIQLISQIRDRFGVELSIEALFDDPTVRGIAAQISAAGASPVLANDPEFEELIRLSAEVPERDLEALLTK
jgi:phthiocerol/phenolphthiocerol synthesis type-I polyketide synthase E